MEYIESPNLPKNKVKKILISSDCSDEILNELGRCGTEVILAPENIKVETSIARHADISILHTKRNQFVCAENLLESFKFLLNEAEIKPVKKAIKSPYPYDVALNIALIGKYAIFNPKTISEEMFGYFVEENYTEIHVKQGYTKCNVVPVCEDAIITEDANIYNQAKKYMDVLFIPSGKIILQGYPYGFIGGSTGKLAKDVLAITGSLKFIPERESMISFCNNHHVSIYELSNRQPIDLGSIIPLQEE